MIFTKVTSFRQVLWLSEIIGNPDSGFFRQALLPDPQLFLIEPLVFRRIHRSIHRDESVFPDPENFDISRWLALDEATGNTVLRTDLKHYAYGFGRRRCAGITIADRSMFINTANLLWSFNIRKKVDSEGNEIELDTLAFEDSANSRPRPFLVDFIPRRPDLRKVIEEMGGC